MNTQCTPFDLLAIAVENAADCNFLGASKYLFLAAERSSHPSYRKDVAIFSRMHLATYAYLKKCMNRKNIVFIKPSGLTSNLELPEACTPFVLLAMAVDNAQHCKCSKVFTFLSQAMRESARPEYQSDSETFLRLYNATHAFLAECLEKDG